MPRASGKTTLLIEESARTGMPIIEPNTASARYVEEQARKMGVKIPEPISATSWNGRYYRGSDFSRIDGFLIDEVDLVLANIFGSPIYKATYTEEREGTQINHLKEKMDQYKIAINYYEKRIYELEKRHRDKEEDTMSKFKVGDVIKVKSVEEMRKSSLMDDDME